MYVFFDLNKGNFYKTNDLQNLRNFVDKNFTINIEWWKLGAGEKVVFSECGEYTVEPCKVDLKGKHLSQTIADVDGTLEKQN